MATLTPAAPPEETSSPIRAYLQRLHARYADLRDGEVASYIPELSTADPDAFGIVIATVRGSIYEAGDTRIPFTLQSLSKPFTYAHALDRLGDERVHQSIGVEPTGDAFNSLTLDPIAGTPLNAMINAGAIAAVGLAGQPDPTDAMARLLGTFERFAGHALTVDERVYESERATGHRNRAMAHLLRSNGVLEEDPDAVVERYFRQCSIAVDARDVAVMAATLAGGGRHPITGEQVASRRTIRTVLSVMASCGMYDGAGAWFVGVGLPAKSGVSGGILAVLPGQLGIAVWSPPVDTRGNSVRGIAVCRDLSGVMDLHTFTAVLSQASPYRAHATLAARRSKRVRPPREQSRIAEEGSTSHLFELHGDVGFATVEAVVRAIGPLAAAAHVVLDLARVTWIEAAVAPLLVDLAADLADERGSRMAWSAADAHATILDTIDEQLAAEGIASPQRFPELDAAAEWCENRILESGPMGMGSIIAVEEHPLLAGLPALTISTLEAALEARTWQPGDVIVRRGDPAGDLYLLTGGHMSVYVPMDGQPMGRRLATLTGGMVMGEVSFLSDGVRSADVIADSEVTAMVLHAEAFRHIRQRQPEVAAALLESLHRVLAEITTRLTGEVAVLAA
jgi:glutaminase